LGRRPCPRLGFGRVAYDEAKRAGSERELRMNERFLTAWVLVASVLVAYFLLDG
jgi:hypothetical protein